MWLAKAGDGQTERAQVREEGILADHQIAELLKEVIGVQPNKPEMALP